MKSKPLTSMPGNSATLHIKTTPTNGTVSHTEGSQLNKARPGPGLPNWETTSQWGLGSLAKAVEDEQKPKTWAEPPEKLWSCYCNPKCAVINPGDNVAQRNRSLPDSEDVAGPGWTAERNAAGRDGSCPTGMAELSDGECSTVTHGERGQRDKNWEVLGWLNLQSKSINWLKPNLQWTYLGLRK